jgi:hypothetical protein
MGPHLLFWPTYQASLSMTPFLALPAEIQHVIDEDSPLYGLTQADLVRLKAEIAFVMEGTIAVRFADLVVNQNRASIARLTFVAQFVFVSDTGLDNGVQNELCAAGDQV